jgi:EmrB/QacA subfamily drug resistance transporter
MSYFKKFILSKQSLLLLSLCLPVTIACIDLMALGTAIDKIRFDFSTSITTTQWLLSGYTIGTASFLITIGRMADIFGRRKTLLLGVLLFALSSLIASISNSIDLLIFSRFSQGVASSIMMTTVISIITNHFPSELRSPVIAKWAFSLGIGMTIGPLIGAILVYYLNWRAIFAINIPICILAYYLIFTYVPESIDKASNITIDWIETIILSVVMILLVTILSQGKMWGWLSFTTLLLLSFFIISFLSFFYIELSKGHPLIDLSLFTLKNFSTATFCGFLSYFCMYAWLFLFSSYLQKSHGLTALKTGLVLSSFSIAFVFSSKLINPMSKKFGNKKLIHIGFILSIFVFLLMSTINLNTGLNQLAIMFFLLGICITLLNATSMIMATEIVPGNKSGIASGTIFTIRWLGGSIGIAVIAMVYESRVSIPCFVLAIVSLIGFIFSTLLKKK